MTSITALLLIPVISGLIGWITNYIAVKMLFRPREKRNLCGLAIQGLIPKRQHEIAESVGATVGNTLLSVDDVTSTIGDSETVAVLRQQLTQRVDSVMASLATNDPMIGMFLKGPIADSAKRSLINELESSLPQIVNTIGSAVRAKVDFSQIIANRIRELDLVTLENVVQDIAHRELKLIEVLGGALGFFVGLLQLLMIVATS